MMRADLRHMVCESLEFAFDDGVFNEIASTDAVFSQTVAPMIADVLGYGGIATVMW